MKSISSEHTDKPVDSTIHTFEQAGLGKAPYKYLGVSENRFPLGGGEWKPGGCCDYCFTGILYEFAFRSADGKFFKVGSECIYKSGDHGLRKVVDAAVNKIKLEQRHAIEKVKLEEVKALMGLDVVRDALIALPHSNKVRAAKGENRWMEANWYMANAGTKGKLSWLKELRKLAGGQE